MVSEAVEAVCTECGLVVSVDNLEREPGLKARGPDTADRTGEWAIEPTTDLRVDKGLHTTFFLQTDGKGNKLNSERMDKMERLRRHHKRFTMPSKRDKRLNEGFRDIGMLGANLALPRYVQTDASRMLKAAKRARLPGGRMAWESLAAGAVLLAMRQAGIEREPADVARYAKTDEERACAAARKIRMQTEVEAPPVRERVVDRIIGELGTVGVDVATGLELRRLAVRLLEIADAVPVGPGTTRMTVAGAAVYSADRLTDGKTVKQAEVVDAVETVLPTSQSKIASYSQALYDEVGRRPQLSDATGGLVGPA
ncbi:transcription initiation factor IIB family protein [Halorarum halophilum]|uniref:Transcription initiation factor IIB family protein n=1 Tax=Halorarum halophilum TaxID=2743090 RepID=A0A7D5KXS9_9EURY|nr:transcription initiation factor IIB family protein [Halobaculum halophilum]QLG28678.1 transcription initiation factor IIB family protein [Halobaculum halophilum]